MDRILIIVAVSITAIVTILRTLALLLDYDTTLGYFDAHSAFYISANILTGLYLCTAFVFAILSCLGKIIPASETKHTRFSALALGALTCLFTLVHFVEGFANDSAGVCLMLSVLFATLGLVYYFMTFLVPSKLEPIRAIGALSLVLFGVFYALHNYFNPTLPINGDLKNLQILAATSMFMFFLSEAKRSLGKGRGISARFFTLACMLFCTSVAFPEFIAIITSGNAKFSQSTQVLMLFFVGIYAGVQLFATRVPVAHGAKPVFRADVSADMPSESVPDVVDVSPSPAEESSECQASPSTDDTASPQDDN